MKILSKWIDSINTDAYNPAATETDSTNRKEKMSKREIEKTALTTAELADYLSIDKRTIESWRSLGTGPPYAKLGGLVRYKISSVDKWVADSERLPT